MKALFRKFFFMNTLVLILLVISALLVFTKFWKELFSPYFLVTLIFTYLINLLVFFLAIRNPNPEKRAQTIMVQSFALKFFGYLIIAGIFFFTEEIYARKVAFIVLLFVTYIVFTWIEVSSMIQAIKSEKKT